MESERAMTFGELIDRHQVEVLRYLERLTGRSAEADDLFQETFLRAFAAFGRLRPGSNHRAWLYRIATNQFLNHQRTRARRAETGVPDGLPAHEMSVEHRHDLATRAGRARAAIARLPPRQRAAFVQRTIEEMSYRDIAAGLRCSEEAARAHVYHAVRRLRRELGKELDRQGND